MAIISIESLLFIIMCFQVLWKRWAYLNDQNKLIGVSISIIVILSISSRFYVFFLWEFEQKNNEKLSLDFLEILIKTLYLRHVLDFLSFQFYFFLLFRMKAVEITFSSRTNHDLERRQRYLKNLERCWFVVYNLFGLGFFVLTVVIYLKDE